MGKARLEAFSDGVIAIIITIMVLEMKVPHGTQWSDLAGLVPVFLSYTLSFLNVGIAWINHHHFLHTVKHVNGPILWANMNLLFWLSLLPFTTGWMGENHFAPAPVSLYAINMLLCGLAFLILQIKMIRAQGAGSNLGEPIKTGAKEKFSLAAYLVAIPIALLGFSWVAGAILFLVTMGWFLPDKRIERALKNA